MLSHLHNLSPFQVIRGIFLLVVVLAILFMLSANVGLVTAGGAVLIIAHLIVASGLLYWAGERFVRFMSRLHQRT